jgi:hypothetical protein
MNEKIAYKKGYRFEDGRIISPHGVDLKLYSTKFGYKRFSVLIGNRADRTRKTLKVSVHRFAMYQRHKELLYMFKCVRHKDGNPTNNSYSNLRFGSQSQNMMDRSKKERKIHSINASLKTRKFSDEIVKEIRKNHYSYKETMKKYGISSKGTLWEILNRDYITTKNNNIAA